jgi:hypothetical protein
MKEIEAFVDATRAAEFLLLTRRRVLELARAGKLPAHPVGDGVRRVWRFRLSEIADELVMEKTSAVNRKNRQPNRRDR